MSAVAKRYSLASWLMGPGSFIVSLLGSGCGGKALTNQTGGSPSDTVPNPGVVETCTTANTTWCGKLMSGATDVASAVAVDTQGNVVVAGRTTGALAEHSSDAGQTEPFIAKYDSSGAIIWLREFSSNEQGEALSLVIDSNDDIVVSGINPPADLTEGGFLAKLSSNGDRLWTLHSGQPGGAVAVDAAGNILWLRGVLAGGATLGRYSTGGDSLWSRQLDSSESTVTVDSAGDIIVSGEARDGTHNSGSLTKFAANGDTLWSTADTVGLPLVRAAGSSDDFVVIADDTQWSLRRYTPAGDLIWEKPGDSDLYDATGIAAGLGGALVVVGMSSHFQKGGYDSYVVKYSAEGVRVAGQPLLLQGSYENCALAVGPGGEIYVAGPLLSGAFVARISL